MQKDLSLKNKKAALFPTVSFGDSLLFMIIANHLKEEGFSVTIFHDKFISIKNLFPNYSFKTNSEIDDLKSFDKIIFQNDNKKRTKDFIKIRDEKKLSNISIIYFRYKESKHGKLNPQDFVLDDNFAVADALAKIMKTEFSKESECKKTGIVFPKELKHKKYPKRVILHPTSGNIKKNWYKSKFIRLAKKLILQGYHPVITVSKNERKDFLDVLDHGIDLPLFLDISDFASYVYESGYLIGNDSFAGHLASLLEIETIVLANCRKLLKIWRPAWHKPTILFPPSWVPNIKHLRLRENHFPFFISVNKVFKTFLEIANNQ